MAKLQKESDRPIHVHYTDNKFLRPIWWVCWGITLTCTIWFDFGMLLAFAKGRLYRMFLQNEILMLYVTLPNVILAWYYIRKTRVPYFLISAFGIFAIIMFAFFVF